jgi:hypothetical protein
VTSGVNLKHFTDFWDSVKPRGEGGGGEQRGKSDETFWYGKKKLGLLYPVSLK